MKWLTAFLCSLVAGGIIVYFVPPTFMLYTLCVIPPVIMYNILVIFDDEPELDPEKVFTATLVSVHDGDSVKLKYYEKIESYRVLFIDAPEIGQDYAEESASMLVALLSQGYIEYEEPTNSSYGRNVCKIYVNGVDVGLAMLRRGYAWIDTRYPVPPEYIRAFADAVDGKKGIFAKSNPVHPALYRAKKK